MKRYLHMSIGPVQAFVAQSQRTRDLWASSYLLSFLSAHALRGAVTAGGEIVSPQVAEDPLWRAISTGAKELPTTGSVPNQFIFKVTDDEVGRAVAAGAIEAFMASWGHVCEVVWNQYLPRERESATRAIWDRQIAGFWELAWILDDCESSTGLQARKDWRTLELPDEPGDKCTVMSELQELSGEIRAQGAAARERQDAFWRRVAANERSGKLDLDPKVRLSAIALIKRLFPRVTGSALGWRLDQVSWPSSVDLAAIPWCERVVVAAPDAARTYAQAVIEVRKEGVRTGGVSGQVRMLPERDTGSFTSLDANWFHASYLKSTELEPPLASTDRDRLEHLLAALHKTSDQAGTSLGAPPIYFALLLADGDRMGELRKSIGVSKLSAALGRFSAGVEERVHGFRGVTVYAGGDDVLALLPVDRALDCAVALEQDYRAAFAAMTGTEEEVAAAATATLSAAVVFAHARAPLDQTLAAAHRLLDDVAKHANGRASLAVAVMRRSDPVAQWVTTWRRDGACAVQRLAELVQQMSADQRLLSGALDHAIWDLLRQLGSGVDWKPGTFARLDASLAIEPLIRAAVRQSLSHRDVEQIDEADQLAVKLASQVSALLAPARNPPGVVDLSRLDTTEPPAQAAPELGLDALLIARFLANGGQEGEHQS